MCITEKRIRELSEELCKKPENTDISFVIMYGIRYLTDRTIEKICLMKPDVALIYAQNYLSQEFLEKLKWLVN